MTLDDYKSMKKYHEDDILRAVKVAIVAFKAEGINITAINVHTHMVTEIGKSDTMNVHKISLETDL